MSSSMAVFLSGLVLLLSVGAASAQEEQAAAEEPTARLAQIREMVLYARYATARRAVDAVLVRQDLTATQRNAALEVSAILYIARRRTRRANRVLGELFSRDPNHRLATRDTGPAVRAAFDRARDATTERLTVTLVNRTGPDLPRRGSPELSVNITAGANAIHEMRLSYRNGTTGNFERTIMRRDEAGSAARARIALHVGDAAYQVFFFVEALAPSGAPIGSVGSIAEPLTLNVPAAVPTPAQTAAAATTNDRPGSSTPTDEGGGSVLDEWWFWTLIGLVVVGAGVGVTVGVLESSQGGGPSLGVGGLQ